MGPKVAGEPASPKAFAACRKGDAQMTETDVRIVRLDPLRVASVYAFGRQPEEEAWRKLDTWAKPKGFLDDSIHHRIFGFNNPGPSPETPDYGYELWITVGLQVEPEGEIRILGFAGGLYAVTRCDVQDQDPYEAIPAAWKKLRSWRENSKYKNASHQWLEEHVRPEGTSAHRWILDLYLPIAK